MDEVLKKALSAETKRQKENIELIASENFVSKEVLKLQGSILTNKYAEGYPKKRYYGGCEHVDKFEETAIKYLKQLFGCNFANVQPHSGSSANMAVYRALINPGDKVLGMDLSNGGHLTHGHKLSFSGNDYEIISYGLNEEEVIDYDDLKRVAIKEKPKMIIAGASAYSREIDFKRIGEIAKKINAYFFVDIAHIAGLVVTGLHQSPFPHADVVTSTTHKTLRGPRGGIILTNDENLAKKIDRVVFPGIQGGPLMHVIGAKAQSFYEALQPEFKTYMKNVINNASIFANEFLKLGYKVVSGGTDNHMFLVDVYSKTNLTGAYVEEVLDKINITVNKNSIPNDSLSPMVTSGIRLGTPAMTTKGFSGEDFKKVANIIHRALLNHDNEKELSQLKKKVISLTKEL